MRGLKLAWDAVQRHCIAYKCQILLAGALLWLMAGPVKSGYTYTHPVRVVKLYFMCDEHRTGNKREMGAKKDSLGMWYIIQHCVPHHAGVGNSVKKPASVSEPW